MKFNNVYLVHHVLEKTADVLPKEIALIHNGNYITYSIINSSANKLANFLKALQIKKGDRIRIFYKNSFEYVISYFAILKAGAIAVPLNTESTSDSLIYIFNNCSLKGLISSQQYKPLINKILSNTSSLEWIIFDNIVDENNIPNRIEKYSFSSIFKQQSANFKSTDIIDSDIATILYTSGSTGKPKGVVLSHLNIVTNTKSIVSYLNLTSKDKILVVLPFHYCYGKSLLHTHFMVGGTVVLDNRFLYPNLVLDTMLKEKVTGFSGVPSTFSVLLNHSNFGKITFPDLRYVTQAGGALAPYLIKRLTETIPDKKVYIMYGATEASARLSYLEPGDLKYKLGSIGKAIPNVELKVVNEKGKIAEPMEVGEIVARGSNIMLGYWNDPAETNLVLREDGYHTGDLAKIDHDGYFYIVGRKKDMLKVGGNRFSAKQVEEVVCQLPGIDEIAIIGIDDEILGEVVKAFIVPKPGSTLNEDELRTFCSEKLAKYMQPQQYEFISEMPKNSSGKILKDKLRIKIHTDQI